MRVSEEPANSLDAYGTVPISFEVRSILEVTASLNGLGGLVFTERPVHPPYLKDYDAEAGARPIDWAARFDISRWAFFGAWLGNRRIGGAAVAVHTPGLTVLDASEDQALLWDLRVAPARRRQGVGAALLAAVEAWASVRNYRELKVETQNINVPACRFYASHGFELGGINRFAYRSFPEETQLFWYKEITRAGHLRRVAPRRQRGR